MKKIVLSALCIMLLLGALTIFASSVSNLTYKVSIKTGSEVYSAQAE